MAQVDAALRLLTGVGTAVVGVGVGAGADGLVDPKGTDVPPAAPALVMAGGEALTVPSLPPPPQALSHVAEMAIKTNCQNLISVKYCITVGYYTAWHATFLAVSVANAMNWGLAPICLSTAIPSASPSMRHDKGSSLQTSLPASHLFLYSWWREGGVSLVAEVWDRKIHENHTFSSCI